jgi:serine/threonine protein kinase
MPAKIVSCSKCNRKLRVPNDLLGKQLKCPTCTHIFTAAVNEPVTPDSSPAAQAAPDLWLNCPACGQPLFVSGKFPGWSVKCSTCELSFTPDPATSPRQPNSSLTYIPAIHELSLDDGDASMPSSPSPRPTLIPARSPQIDPPPDRTSPGEVEKEVGPINLNLMQSINEIGTNLVFAEPPGDARPGAPLPPVESGAPDSSSAPRFPTLGAVSFSGLAPPSAKMVAAAARAEDAGGSGTFQPGSMSSAAPGVAATAAPPATGERRKSIRKGSCLGPYRILDLIGEGSFGYVYLAEDSESMLGTRVALKVPKSQSLTPKELELYRHEAKLWRALSEDRHPNVLELKNLNRYDGVIAFVMEYVDGGDLAAFARKARESGDFPLHEALRIVRNVAAALHVIHAKRVYHGDLKPQNVLVRREDGAVKVTDFSVSRSVTTRGQVPEKLVAGTPPYMAPEVWEGKPCLQSDIFALGALFYEIVTGVRPFPGNDPGAVAAAIRVGRIDGLPSERRKELPYALERVILRCLEPAVEDRYPSVGELIEDLQEADTTQDLVSRLADCVMSHSPPEDLDFLVTKELPARGYRGDDPRTLVIEYCLDEEPTEVLLSSFSKAGLARVADQMGAAVEPGNNEREHYAQAILARLGLGSGAAPRGIQDSVRLVNNLRHRLEQCRDAGEVAGFVTPAAREYEKVMRDLLRFYGQFLYGRFYERALVRLARKRLAEHKRDLSRVSLGELIGVVEALNAYLAGDSAEAQHFRRVFGRSHGVPPELLANSKVTAVRNAFMHWNETLAQANLGKIRDTARELLGEVCEFLRAIADGGVYPRIVAVESFVTDRFGRRYVFCRNDQGQLEKVFTNVAVDPSRHYFFYPTTNPMRIYPILVPT